MVAFFRALVDGGMEGEADPIAYLKQAGIQVPEALTHTTVQAMDASMKSVTAAFSSKQLPARFDTAPNDTEQCSVNVSWWGYDIVMNNKLTDDVTSGTIATGTLGTIIATALSAGGVVTGPIGAALAAGFAAAFGIKVLEIKVVNNGSGVHFPVSWIQQGLVVAAISTGPLGVVAAILAFIHPLRN